MSTQGDNQTADQEKLLASIIDISIKLGIVLLLLSWGVMILLPFLMPIIWGVILAVACAPLCASISSKLGGRKNMASAIISILLILAVIIPCWLLADSLVVGVQSVTDAFQSGEITIPPPTAQVKSWPVIGDTVYTYWSQAASDLEKLLQTLAPQLEGVAGRVLGAFASLGVTLLQFLFASIIAGVFLAYSEGASTVASSTSRRIDASRGQEFLDDAVTTVRNVARGILGVAFIQAVLAGIGIAVVGIPGAGLWAMLCLMLGIIQVGVGPIVIPAIIYVFATESILVSVLFLVWGVFVTLIDNILKPILLGKGAPVPMLVIFLGAIGGFINHGIIGLFVGAVVLSLAYKLLIVWMSAQPEPKAV